MTADLGGFPVVVESQFSVDDMFVQNLPLCRSETAHRIHSDLDPRERTLLRPIRHQLKHIMPIPTSLSRCPCRLNIHLIEHLCNNLNRKLHDRSTCRRHHSHIHFNCVTRLQEKSVWLARMFRRRIGTKKKKMQALSGCLYSSARWLKPPHRISAPSTFSCERP